MFYMVAWGVVAVGVLIIVLSPFVGGLLHTQAITPLIELLGAPEDREFLPKYRDQTGTEILAMLGGANLIVGICIFLVGFVIELLGLTGKSRLTRRMKRPGKLALGTAAAGVVVFAAAASLEILFSILFDGYESAVHGIMSALDVISQAGRLLLVCSFITLFLWGSGVRGILFGWGHGIRNVLFGWPDAVGWAKVRCGWINRLALALIVGGLISMTLQFMMPFDDVAGVFFSTGIAALALGIVPELLARGRP